MKSDNEPLRRLMDLLAGWSHFAHEDEFAIQEADAIEDLYQESASLVPGTELCEVAYFYYFFWG